MKTLIALLVVSLSSATLHAQSVWINENVDRDTGLRTGEISLRGGFYTIGPGESFGGADLTGADLSGCEDREEDKGPSSEAIDAESEPMNEESAVTGATLERFLSGKTVNVSTGEGPFVISFYENGKCAFMSENARYYQGTYRLSGAMAALRLEGNQIIVMEFPSRTPSVGSKIGLDVSGEEVKGPFRITAITDAERPPPRTFSDFWKLVGSPLSEKEKQFVGRWSGKDEDGRWWVINRADHTHSYLERGPDGKESLFAHGSWAIRNGALHVLAWVRNGEKNFSAGMDQLKPMELMQEGAIEGFGLFPISSLRDDEIVYEDGFKERRIEAFEEPEMKPFNTPEALKAFDLLKVYKEASAQTASERLHKAFLENLPSDEALKKALQGLPLMPATSEGSD